MPSFSSSAAAWMPSQVEAIFTRMRSRGMPAALYSAMSSRALATVAALSKERRASTSVETRPGTILRISVPKAMSRASTAAATPLDLLSWAAFWRSAWYSGIWTAFRMRLGLVVASRGLKAFMAAKSPVSATTLVC